MHLNHYFLKPLCQELNNSWKGYRLGECFSQQKDELIFHFYQSKEEKFIRASLIPQLTFLSFPATFARGRKNNVDLFAEAIEGAVSSFEIIPNDRSFTLALDNGYRFVFKMHGSRSNIIGIGATGKKDLFRSQLVEDEQVDELSLRKEISFNQTRFADVDGDLRQFLPTLGKEAHAHLNGKGYPSASPEQKWSMLNQLFASFKLPVFYLCRWQGKVQLLLFEEGEVLQKFSSAIDAANAYAQEAGRDFYLRTELNPVLQRLRKELKQIENYLKQSEAKLLELQQGRGYTQLADVLMANLHQVKEGQEEVTLDNFYTGQPVSIRLKRTLSPQKNAEVFYKKAKNQRIEIEKLKEALDAKKQTETRLMQHLLQLEEMTDLKLIRQYLKEHNLDAQPKQEKDIRPFRVYRLGDYEAWVGTNAKNNDELTLKYATKNDLWLHAKDVPGSHVVLKWRAGQNFPQHVVEQAAALAAHFSKRKTDTLCPVIFTPKKYVRKTKGSAPGAVIVEREEVVMVEPGLPGG